MISAASAASDSDGRAAAERSMDVALDAAVHTRRPNRVKGSRYDHSAVTANVPRIADDFWQRSKSTESGQMRPSQHSRDFPPPDRLPHLAKNSGKIAEAQRTDVE